MGSFLLLVTPHATANVFYQGAVSFVDVRNANGGNKPWHKSLMQICPVMGWAISRDPETTDSILKLQFPVISEIEHYNVGKSRNTELKRGREKEKGVHEFSACIWFSSPLLNWTKVTG